MGEIKGSTFPKTKKEILNFNKQEILIKPQWVKGKLKWKEKKKQKNNFILIGFSLTCFTSCCFFFFKLIGNNE